MFGIGMPELILILVIALLVFGPKKLPEIAKTIGKGMGELRKATDDLKDTWEAEVEAQEEEAQRLKEAQKDAAPATAALPATAESSDAAATAEPPTGPPMGEEISAGHSLAYPGEEELLEPTQEEAANEAPTASAPGQSAYVPDYPAEEEMVQANPEVIEETVAKEERSPKTDV